MGRGTRVAGVMVTTLVMMTATAAGISAVNFAVSATSGGTPQPADTVVLAAAVTPDAVPVAAAAPGIVPILEPLPDTPLPRIDARKVLAQATSAPAYVAPRYTAAPAAPRSSGTGHRAAGSHDGQDHHESEGGDESDD